MQTNSCLNLIHIRNALWINSKLSIHFNIYFHWYGLEIASFRSDVICKSHTHTHKIGSIIRAKYSAFTNFLFIDIVWEMVVFCANSKQEEKGSTSRRSTTLCECGNSKRDAQRCQLFMIVSRNMVTSTDDNDDQPKKRVETNWNRSVFFFVCSFHPRSVYSS